MPIPQPATMPAPAEMLSFVRRLDAVQGVTGELRGPNLLVPLGSCVLAIASESTAGPGADWLGQDGCTRLAQSAGGPPMQRPGFGVQSAVTMDNGSIIGVQLPNAAQGYLVRRDPDGTVHRLATLPDMSSTIAGIARVGNRLLVTTTAWVDVNWGAVVWESTDGGATVRKIPLPRAHGVGARSGFLEDGIPGLIAVHGSEVVIASTAPTNSGAQAAFVTWRSSDGGVTWSASSMVLESTAHTLLWAGDRWLILLYDAPRILSSTDGRHWTPGNTATMGPGKITGGTIDHDGQLVLLGGMDSGQRISVSKIAGIVYCPVLWTGPVNGPLTRGDVGCRAELLTAVATLADGRVMIVGGKDLWIRS